MAPAAALAVTGKLDTAVTMAMEQNIPIVVFKLLEPGNMKRVVLGLEVGTVVEKREP